jgi:hypothetical protein
MDEAAGPGTVGLQLDGPGTLRSRRLTAEALWGKPDEAGKTLRATDDDRQGHGPRQKIPVLQEA